MRVFREHCFANCRITGIAIPGSVRHIEKAAFKDCPLFRLHFDPDGILELIGTEAFMRTYVTELVTPRELKYIGKRAFQKTLMYELELNEGLEEIDDRCFQGTQIMKMNVPKTLKRIGDSAL